MDKQNRLAVLKEAVGRGIIQCPSNWGSMTDEEVDGLVDEVRKVSILGNGRSEAAALCLDEGEMEIASVVAEREKICKRCCNSLGGNCRLLDDPEALHGLMNVKKDSCPIGKWVVQYEHVDDVGDLPPACSSDRLLITMATDPKFEKLLDMTRPRMEEYADKVGADFYELHGETQAWWMMEKYRVGPIAEQYPRTIYVDADVIFLPHAPNLFEYVPEDLVGIHDDWDGLQTYQHTWHRREREEMMLAQGVEPYQIECMWNSGVVVHSKEHCSLWTPPPRPFKPSHCAEQVWMENNLRKLARFPLPTELNTQYWRKDFYQLIRTAKIVHLAGCDIEDRYDLTEKILQWS